MAYRVDLQGNMILNHLRTVNNPVDSPALPVYTLTEAFVCFETYKRKLSQKEGRNINTSFLACPSGEPVPVKDALRW